MRHGGRGPRRGAGSHREAAAQYERALRFAGGLPPAELAALLELHAQECYLTNRIDDAVAAQERALECYRALGDRRREAAALCALAELIWCPGRIAASKRASLDALEALEGLPPGREAALAYLNLAIVARADRRRHRACEARRGSGRGARRPADRSYGLVSRSRRSAPTGIPPSKAGDRSRRCSHPRWRRARRGGVFDLGARGPCRAAIPCVFRRRSPAQAGLAFCGERDLEIYARYLYAARAQAALARARWGEASNAATIVLHDPGPSVIPLLNALVVAALADARQGNEGPNELLERAADRAAQQGAACIAHGDRGARRVGLAAGAARTDRRPDRRAVERAVARQAWREASALARWRRRAGLHDDVPGAVGGRCGRVRGRLGARRAALERGRAPVRGSARSVRSRR